jgi:spermidine synthase
MNLMAKPFEKFFKPRREPEISLSEEDGVRYLHFGSVWIQGAMRVRDPYGLELEYTRELFAGLLLHPAPRSITLLGLGAGSASKFAWKSFPKAKITTVELNSAVIAVARSQFSLPAESKRMSVICGDAQEVIAGRPGACDYLIVDLYDAAARGPVLSSLEFYSACRAAMAAEGPAVMAVNLFGRHSSYETNLRNIGKAFDGRMLVLPPSERGNVIAFGFAGDVLEPKLTELRARASRLKESLGLDFPRWLAGFKKANTLAGDQWEV